MKKKGIIIGVICSIFFGATTIFIICNDYANIHLSKLLGILTYPVQLICLLIFGGNDSYFGFFVIASVIFMLAMGFLFGYCLCLIYQKLRRKGA